MSATDLHKAIAEVKQQQELAALVAAVLQQLPAVAAPAPAPVAHHGCGCQQQHQVPAANRSLRPLAIGGAVVVGGCVLTGMFLAVALASVAVAISAIVLYLLFREVKKGGK
jgi:type VI protein secretion system component VasF